MISPEIQNSIDKHLEVSAGHLKRLEEAVGKSFKYSVDFEAHHRSLPDSIQFSKSEWENSFWTII